MMKYIRKIKKKIRRAKQRKVERHQLRINPTGIIIDSILVLIAIIYLINL